MRLIKKLERHCLFVNFYRFLNHKIGKNQENTEGARLHAWSVVVELSGVYTGRMMGYLNCG